MTSSYKIQFTLDARRDVRDILRRTLHTWGQHQQDAYAVLLQESLERLIQFPEIGHARDDLPREFRRYPTGEHVIYYRIDGVTISIIRILHRRMSPDTLEDW